MREHKQIALHVVCGDITDVEIVGSDLIINVFDGMLLNLLTEGRREIENALRWQGLDYNVKINVKDSKLSASEKDLKKLQEVFGLLANENKND